MSVGFFLFHSIIVHSHNFSVFAWVKNDCLVGKEPKSFYALAPLTLVWGFLSPDTLTSVFQYVIRASCHSVIPPRSIIPANPLLSLMNGLKIKTCFLYCCETTKSVINLISYGWNGGDPLASSAAHINIDFYKLTSFTRTTLFGFSTVNAHKHCSPQTTHMHMTVVLHFCII